MRQTTMAAMVVIAALAAGSAQADSPGRMTGTVDHRDVHIAGVCYESPDGEAFSFTTDGGEEHDVDGDGVAVSVGAWGPHWSLLLVLDNEQVFHGMVPFQRVGKGASLDAVRKSVDGREVDLELLIDCE
jgi:hypothetical protein